MHHTSCENSTSSIQLDRFTTTFPHGLNKVSNPKLKYNYFKLCIGWLHGLKILLG